MIDREWRGHGDFSKHLLEIINIVHNYYCGADQAPTSMVTMSTGAHA